MAAKNPTRRHRIAFCADGCTMRVVPGHLEVEAGEWVTFSNLYAGLVDVWIPSKDLFGKKMIFTLKPGHKSEALRVVKGAIGCYPYAAYDPVTREFGHGSGVPIIIVYPKEK